MSAARDALMTGVLLLRLAQNMKIMSHLTSVLLLRLAQNMTIMGPLPSVLLLRLAQNMTIMGPLPSVLLLRLAQNMTIMGPLPSVLLFHLAKHITTMSQDTSQFPRVPVHLAQRVTMRDDHIRKDQFPVTTGVWNASALMVEAMFGVILDIALGALTPQKP
jgi:hypothetical protein